MTRLYGIELTREELRRHAGRPEQLVGAELFERSDGSERGVRCVRLRSGVIELEVVVDGAVAANCFPKDFSEMIRLSLKGDFLFLTIDK